MFKKSGEILLAVLVLMVMLGTGGCEGEVSITTAHFNEATMALGVDANNKPVDPTTVFSTEIPEIFCSAKLSNAPDDTEINSSWIYVKGELADLTDYEIGNYTLTTGGTQYIQFSLTKPDNGWPRGNYKLVLSIDGKEVETLEFTVE